MVGHEVAGGKNPVPHQELKISGDIRLPVSREHHLSLPSVLLSLLAEKGSCQNARGCENRVQIVRSRSTKKTEESFGVELCVSTAFEPIRAWTPTKLKENGNIQIAKYILLSYRP